MDWGATLSNLLSSVLLRPRLSLGTQYQPSTVSSPQVLAQTPKRLAQTPRRLAQTPRRLAQTPRRLAQTPRRLTQTPKRLTQNPDYLIYPNTYFCSTAIICFFVSTHIYCSKLRSGRVDNVCGRCVHDSAYIIGRASTA